MSETWKATYTSIQRLKAAWREADEDARYGLAFWSTGMAVMAGSIVAEFGWSGAAFCIGFVVWQAGLGAHKL